MRPRPRRRPPRTASAPPSPPASGSHISEAPHAPEAAVIAVAKAEAEAVAAAAAVAVAAAAAEAEARTAAVAAMRPVRPDALAVRPAEPSPPPAGAVLARQTPAATNPTSLPPAPPRVHARSAQRPTASTLLPAVRPASAARSERREWYHAPRRRRRRDRLLPSARPARHRDRPLRRRFWRRLRRDTAERRRLGA
jgi:hypothetical protein